MNDNHLLKIGAAIVVVGAITLPTLGAIAALVCTLATALIGVLIVHRLAVSRIVSISACLERVEKGDLSERLPEPGQAGEISTLQRRANRLISQLEAHADAEEESDRIRLTTQARFRRYFELGLIGIAVTSPQKGWLEVNDRLCEIFGHTREELLAKTWAEITHPDDLAADVAHFDRVLTGEIDGYAMDKRFFRSDGAVIYASISVKCLRRSDGAVDHFVAFVHDITDRKQAEAALRESEEKFRTIVTNAQPIVFAIDLEGRFILSEGRDLAALGLAPGEVVGQSAFDLYADNSHVIDGIRQALAGRPSKGITEVQGLTFDTFYSPYRNSEGEIVGMVGMAVDISERRAMEREILRAATDEQQRIGRDLHDGLGQELTGIAMLASALHRRLAERSPGEALDAAEISTLIGKAIQHTQALVRGLAPFKLEPGADGFIESLRGFIESIGRIHGVECSLESGGTPSIPDHTTATHLYYIAQEAINNAVKHGRPSRIDVRIETRYGRTSLTVRDDGSGFVEGAKGSSGQGLSIMSHRASMLAEGVLTIDSASGEGATVTCTFRS